MNFKKDVLEKYYKNNKKVEIEVLTSENKAKIFRTDFYKKNIDSYSIYKPQEECEFFQNQEIKLILYTKDGIYIFSSKIEKVSSKIIEVSIPSAYKKLQRRNFLRAQINQKFILENEGFKKELLTNNMSGSGVSFYFDEIIDKSKIYKATLFFEDRKIISRIKIVEIRKNLKPEFQKYRYSAKFISLNEIDKNYIVKLCIKNNVENINF